MQNSGFNRRKLARALSLAAKATLEDILDAADHDEESIAKRTGITGPAGVGKSTLVNRLVEARLAKEKQIGVLAVDPSSPVTQGAILGDRIRMDSAIENPNLYFRSVSSTYQHDGLCHNITGMLNVFDYFGFDEIILETVGVGQTDYDVRHQVDVVILVLSPESGDIVQAMKAGILEIADIYVINKSDLNGADRLAGELNNVLQYKNTPASGWSPRITKVSAKDGAGINELDIVIDEYYQWSTTNLDRNDVQNKRRLYQLGQLVNQGLRDVMEGHKVKGESLRELYQHAIAELGSKNRVSTN